jgi:glycosyltransferase involved in cell wall biosynthesis
VRTKILHVTQSTGGVETSLLLLFRHLDHTRFELHLACPPDTTLAARAAELGVQVFPIQMVRGANPWRDVAGLVALWRLMRRERYTIVHAHSAKGGYLGRLAARLAGRSRAVYSTRAFSYLSQRGVARWFFLQLERWAVPLTDVLLAASASEAQRAIREVGFLPECVRVIPNAVDLSEAPADVGAPATPPMVLTVGRLIYQKNPELFVRTAARVARVRPDVRFVMAGAGFAGPLEHRVRRVIAELGLGGRIEIVPWVPKPEALRLIAACTVFVLTSRFEGMPNTVLEAMAVGKPVVATDVDGTRDVVDAGATGYLVPLDADQAMADSIVRLLEAPELALRMGSAGAALARERHDIRRTAQCLDGLYGRLIDEAREPA